MAGDATQEATVAKPSIYCFVNGQWSSGDLVTLAIAEDGHVLAQHVSSSIGWAQCDITGEWKWDRYNAHYPDGWQLVWVDYEDVDGHEGLQEAFRLNGLLAREVDDTTEVADAS